MTGLEVVGVGLMLGLLALATQALVRLYGVPRFADPGAAWARRVCELAYDQRGYRSTQLRISVEELGEWAWEVTAPGQLDGTLVTLRVATLLDVEDVLRGWWHSPAGRRVLRQAELGR